MLFYMISQFPNRWVCTVKVGIDFLVISSCVLGREHETQKACPQFKEINITRQKKGSSYIRKIRERLKAPHTVPTFTNNP